MRPMASAPRGVTKPQTGATATNPATIPEANPNAVGLPRCSHSATIQLNAAAAAATCEAARAAPAWPLLAKALPPLKPNQPNHRRPAPVSVSTMLLGCTAGSG